MALTRIKADDFETLSVAKYFRLLEKDLVRLSRKPGLKEYTFIKNYKVKGKKQSVFIFAGLEDEDWAPVLAKAIEVGTKYSTGKCKVLEVPDETNPLDDDITIAIKTATGSMNKTNTVKLINEDVFEDNEDVEAVDMRDFDDDKDDEKIKATRKKNTGSVKLSEDIQFDDLDKIKTEIEDPYYEELQKILKAEFKDNSPDVIFKSYHTEMGKLSESLKESSISEVLPKAIDFDIRLEVKIDDLDDFLDLFRTWAEFAKSTIEETEDEEKENWLKKRAALLPVFQQVKTLHRRLDKLETILEDKFGFGGDAEKLIDAFNDLSYDFKRLEKIKDDTEKVEVLLHMDAVAKKGMAASNKEDDVSKLMLARFKSASEKVQEKLKLFEDSNNLKAILLSKEIQQNELKLKKLKPLEFIDQLKLVATLESQIQEYEKLVVN